MAEESVPTGLLLPHPTFHFKSRRRGENGHDRARGVCGLGIAPGPGALSADRRLSQSDFVFPRSIIKGDNL